MFKITTVGDRLKQKSHIKGIILGEFGKGKTFLATTLEAKKTFFVDIEGTDETLGEWVDGEKAGYAPIRDWPNLRFLASVLSGPNQAKYEYQSYSQSFYDRACEEFSPDILKGYETIFIDSLSRASNICLEWCKGRPEAISEKTGKPDVRNAYGLLATEMIDFLTQLQYVDDKNIWCTATIYKEIDDTTRRSSWQMQITGSKAGTAIPGILDQVYTIADLKNGDTGEEVKKLVCHEPNPWGYKAKNRGGALDMVEDPDLGKIMAKIIAHRKNK